MKKFAWFKHHLSNGKRLSALIDHEGKRGSGMARKLHRICQTIGKKLIENYQTTDKELPNNLETLCKNEEKQNNNNHLKTSTRHRKPTLARVRGEKRRKEKSREDEKRKNDFVVKKSGDDGEVQAAQNAMPPFRFWQELTDTLTEGSEWKNKVCNPSLQMPHLSGANAIPERGKCHTWTSVKCGIGPAQMWHRPRPGVASRALNPIIAR